MIVTEQKAKEDIAEALKGYKSIFIIGCGECATACKTGGEHEVLQMAQFLKSEGKDVAGYCIPDSPCISSQIKSSLAKHIKAVHAAEAFLVLACGLGAQSVKASSRKELPVFIACDTICQAVMDSAGNFAEKCSSCGECLLNSTATLCPISLCPKGILNGPCGGMDKGKCEVDKDRDCAWVLIYNELQKRNKQDEMRNILEPKNYNKTTKPRQMSKK